METSGGDVDGPVTIGRPSFAGLWPKIGLLVFLVIWFVPAYFGAGRTGGFLGLIAVVAVVDLVVTWQRRRTRWVLEPDAIRFDARFLGAPRRISVAEISHVVEASEDLLLLVSKRALAGEVLPSLSTRSLTQTERTVVRRWLARRFEVRAEGGRRPSWLEASKGCAPASTGGGTQASLQVGLAWFSRANTIAYAGGLLALVVFGIATGRLSAHRPHDVIDLLTLCVWLPSAWFAPNRVRIFDDDAIRWRRGVWGRERRIGVADIDHVEELLGGDLVFKGRGTPAPNVGPRLALGALPEFDVQAVRRWISARFSVRGPMGDRVPWAARSM